jgi:hypothetical protein
MGDWTELPGFPRTYPSFCAYGTSSVRLVDGQRQVKGDKTVTLSGAKAFAQRLESEIIAGHRTNKDVPALLGAVLDAWAKHIDVVEWCRVKGDEVDLSLRIYASRGSTRLHLSVLGPVGKFADRPLPARVATAAPRSPSKKKSPAPSPPAVEKRAPPASTIVLQPIAPGAEPDYGNVLAMGPEGLLHAAIRLPAAVTSSYHYALVDPGGSVRVTPLASRADLRKEDPGAMTGCLMPSVHATEVGIVRVESYDTAAGDAERVGLAPGGPFHAARRTPHYNDFVLGVRGGWFLRCLSGDGAPVLLGVHLGSGKRCKVVLPEKPRTLGVALDRGDHVDVLRVLHDDGAERRYPLRAGSALEVDLTAEVVSHGLSGSVQPLPGGGFTVADNPGERCRIRLVRGGESTEIFSFPAAGHRPWGFPRATEIQGERGRARFLVDVDFGDAERPRCRGVVVVTGEGGVLATALVDPEGKLRIGDQTLAMGNGEHVVAYAAGPAGDLAALIHLQAGLTLVWCPPPAAAGGAG